MITFGVWSWNDAKGGMRFAFPPYGLTGNPEEEIEAFYGNMKNMKKSP